MERGEKAAFTDLPSRSGMETSVFNPCGGCGNRHKANVCCCGATVRRFPSSLKPQVTLVVCGAEQPCSNGSRQEFPLDLEHKSKYSFEAEWHGRALRLSSSCMTVAGGRVTTPCHGVTCFSGLNGSRMHGAPTKELLRRLPLVDLGFPRLAQLVEECCSDDSNLDRLIANHGVGLYIGQGDRVRSVFCAGIANSSALVCDGCQAVEGNRAAAIRNKRLLQQGMTCAEAISKGGLDHNAFNGIRDDTLTVEIMVNKLFTTSLVHQLQTKSANKKIAVRDKKINELRLELVSALACEDGLPDFVRKLRVAYDEGLFNGREALVDILNGVGEALNKGTKNRVLSKCQKVFYQTLLTHGGPRVHDFVSDVLLGPHVRTTKRQRNKHSMFFHSGISKDVFEYAAGLLKEYGLEGAPCFIAEDATALQSRLEAVLLNKTDVIIIGSCKGVLKVHCIDDVKNAGDLASMFYLYTLVPLVDGAPIMPLFVDWHNNTKATFNSTTVVDRWKQMHQYAKECDINLVGHVSDGAPACRSACLRTMHLKDKLGQPQLDRLVFDHPLIQLSVPKLSEAAIAYILTSQDFMHIDWRVRVQFLRPDKMLSFGGLPISHAKLWTAKRLDKEAYAKLGLRYKDLDYHEKQHNEGCLRLFDFVVGTDGTVEPKTAIRDFLHSQTDGYGTYLFVEFAHRYVSTFVVKDKAIEDIIKDVGFVLAFLALWEKGILDHNNTFNLKQNFITRETKVDIIISLNNIILAILLFRKYFPNIKLVPSRVSSRFVEYMFQFLRAGGNHNKITALTGLTKLNTYDSMLENLACRQGTGSTPEDKAAQALPNVREKRGMKKGKKGVDANWNKAPEGYYPDDNGIQRMLDKGVAELETLLKVRLTNETSSFCMWTDFFNKSMEDSIDPSELATHLLKKKDAFHSVHDWSSSTVIDDNFDDDEYDRDDETLDDRPVISVAVTEAIYGCVIDACEEYDEEHADTDMAGIINRNGTIKGRDLRKAKVDMLRHDVKATKVEETLLKTQLELNDIVDGICDTVAPVEDSEDGEVVQLYKQAREVCHELNGRICRQGTDRVAGRFLGLELRNKSVVVSEEERYYEEGDVVAILYHGHEEHDAFAEFAIVEKCIKRYTTGSGKSKFENVHLLHQDEVQGRLLVRFFEAAMKPRGGQLRINDALAFTLPICSSFGYNEEVDTTMVISTVGMNLVKHGNKGYFVLRSSDEKVVNKVVKEHIAKIKQGNRRTR